MSRNIIARRLRISMPVTTISQAQYSQHSGPYSAQTYQRRDAHKAQTNHEHEESYVLTLHTDADHHKQMTSLRTRYFPQELNKLDAHIALFRALPGSQLPRITRDITSLIASQAPFSIRATEPFRMRQGVGIRVVDDSNPGTMKSIYSTLRDQWKEFSQPAGSEFPSALYGAEQGRG